LAEAHAQRKLAAILAADVAGYSRLIGDDEEGTLSALTTHLETVIKPCISEKREVRCQSSIQSSTLTLLL
jgi:adenylate cyclase